MSNSNKNYYQPTNTIENNQLLWENSAQDNDDDDARLKENIGNLPFTQTELLTNSKNSNYEKKLAEEILAKNRAKENEILKPRNPINKIIASEKFYTIPANKNLRTNNDDYSFLRNTNPRIAILVEGFKDDSVNNDGVDDIFKDLCEKDCTNSEKLYIKLSTESHWKFGNRGKPFNKLIKEYDNYKKVKGKEARYAWRMRNWFGRRFMDAGKKKTKRKKRKHVKSKKSRKTRKYVKSRKQRKSRRKN